MFLDPKVNLASNGGFGVGMIGGIPMGHVDLHESPQEMWASFLQGQEESSLRTKWVAGET